MSVSHSFTLSLECVYPPKESGAITVPVSSWAPLGLNCGATLIFGLSDPSFLAAAVPRLSKTAAKSLVLQLLLARIVLMQQESLLHSSQGFRVSMRMIRRCFNGTISCVVISSGAICSEIIWSRITVQFFVIRFCYSYV